ncbi:MAG TPA: hypothetical protein VIF62_01450 [Labilithrix sp.]
MAARRRPPTKKSKPEKKTAKTLAPKKKTRRALSKAPKKKTVAKAKRAGTRIPAPRPSVPHAPPLATESSPADSALAVVAQLPAERALTDEEREAMLRVAQTAQRFLSLDGVPEVMVRGIGAYVDDVRNGRRAEPKGQDLRLGLGVLWGEQVRAQVGWRWVHLTYPNGFASYALVPDDRAFACFPLNRLPELLKAAYVPNTSARLFERIRSGELPARRENAYLVIG